MSYPFGKWRAWTCEEHNAWFSPDWITENVVGCIENNCRVSVFTGDDGMTGGYVRHLLFSPACRWVFDKDEVDPTWRGDLLPTDPRETP